MDRPPTPDLAADPSWTRTRPKPGPEQPHSAPAA